MKTIIKNKIEKNFARLSEPLYRIENIFQRESYEWPGDWEGRALLAFVCQYLLTGKKIPCMDSMVALLPEKTNKYLYFGKAFDGKIADEQQLSGHSWYLRALVKYAQTFKSDKALKIAESTVEHLYLPLRERYKRYPIERQTGTVGGVSGNACKIQNDWLVSTDIGCAFMAIDGLAHYYAETKDERVAELLKIMIDVFMRIDKTEIKMQTHATLSAARGIIEFYEAEGEEKYLQYAKDIFALYIGQGMTLNYENFNWFGRPDTWTEPCAIVDSMIVALKLFRLTDDLTYKTLARRILFNGLQFCQRFNGGAGTNSCVTAENPVLKINSYEAPFCCTMRYAEGLLYAAENEEIFADNGGEIFRDERGRVFMGDKLLAEDLSGLVAGERYTAFGKELVNIPSLTDYPEETAKAVRLKIVID